MGRNVRTLLISVAVGFVFLVVAGLLIRDGFPFSYWYWVAGCAAPGFACIALNPVIVGIDYVFWFTLAFAFIFGLPKGLRMLTR